MENLVKELREKANLNQSDLAKIVSVSRQTISSIENGRYNPSLELAFKISNYFNKSVEEIFIYKNKGKNE